MSRLRCPEIRRLPKSSKVTAIQWRNQTPGALDPLFTPGRYRPDMLVDPFHPGVNLRKGLFPAVQRDDLGIKMIPSGLLLREEKQFPAIPILTWRERVEKAKEAGITSNRRSKTPNIENSKFGPGEQLYPERDYNDTLLPSRNSTPSPPIFELKLKKAERRVPISFHISTSKARMGHDRHQRKWLETRIRAALNLIVAKGAFRDVAKNKIGINLDDSGRKWIMQGWAYMFFPTLKINRMPYVKLIDLLRLLLKNMNSKAIAMENEWLNESLLKGEAPLRKPRLLESEKSRVMKAAPSTKPLEPFRTLPKTPLLLPASESSSVPEHLHSKKHKYKYKYKRANTKNVPSKSLAGKSPAVWRKELISELTLLVDPPSCQSKVNL